MSEYSRFLNESKIKAGDETHRLKILKAITTYETTVDAMKNHQFKNWMEAREIASQVKLAVIEKLPFLLEEFESKISARGAKVLWARDKKEAQDHFLEIATRHGAKKIVKSKSMTTEEIDFNEFCESKGLTVLESDLGELIVQLAGEKPYHIVTPAMHKSRAEIGKLFAEKLNVPLSEDARELTMIAREHLRNAYITSDIGVTGANFIIAKEGAVALTENEGNIRLTMACPPVHVVFVGIEKVVPGLADLSLFWPLLATSGTGQQITGYNSIIRGPRQEGETDGPDNLYVILLDNGRSDLYNRENYQKILKCIRCGACLNACPVYRTIGGHTYHTTYQGPIGSVLTPQLKEPATWSHLAAASSLCASCSAVCPVDIDIHHLLLENRWEANQHGYSGKMWDLGLNLWARIMSKRSRLNRYSRIGRRLYPLFLPLLPKSIRKRVPDLPGETFNSLWKKYEQSK